MCGIGGAWGEKDEEPVRNMMEILRHRGPDAEGVYVSSARPGLLGHRRLSIMDPVGGDQPIHNEARTAAIIANGEIYNFRKLKRNIQARHTFSTSSDSEVILHLFEEHGPGMVSKLDGMFAFAIAEGDNIFLARDPIGIKPLYYGTSDEEGIFYFASELKALCDSGMAVKEFPPGTCYYSEKGFIPYYRVPRLSARDLPFEKCAGLLRGTLEESVTKRLMSDVPLGTFLSGGLDSSIISAISKKHMRELHTFSVGIEGSDDIEAARLVSRHIGSIHHEYIFTSDEVMEKLPEIIYYLESFDQDLVRSAIPCYFCSRLASDYVKVILTGEGADELFAGYTYYKGITDAATLQEELLRSVNSLHNINLQRVDRMTMAHSIEGRVPFLDISMIEMAQMIPPQFKLYEDDSGRLVEKWILRVACEDLLPREIIMRDKSQFDEGSGTVDLLEGTLKEGMTENDAFEYMKLYPGAGLRSAEECFYHRIFMEVFKNPSAVLENVARWADRPLSR